MYSAYKRGGLRDELDRVQSLNACKLRRSDGCDTRNTKGNNFKGGISVSSISIVAARLPVDCTICNAHMGAATALAARRFPSLAIG